MNTSREREALKAMLKMLFDQTEEAKIILESDFGRPYTLILPDGSHTHSVYVATDDDAHLECAVDSLVEFFTGGARLSTVKTQ